MRKKIIITGVSVTGPAHIVLRIPNQDSYSAKIFKSGFIAVVADGLGSSRFSNVGSKAVCRAVIDASGVWIREKSNSCEKLLKLIKVLWELYLGNYSVEDCGTTCLFVILRNNELLLFQLGDGLILNSGKNGNYVHPASKKEFSNLTNSMHNNKRIDEWSMAKILVKGGNSLMICTDGIADDLFCEKYFDFMKFIKSKISGIKKSKRESIIRNMLVNWPTKNHTDDKTILIIDY